mmetsp:Transcript_16485/g.33262  ORF Transcript_16485/g.33262 Transcript_16485/m.33262 type:complete len:549 (+) Transcript_16485:184-1830(+)
MMATPHNNVRRHSRHTSSIKRAPLLGALHLQLLLSILVATSNYCNFGSYSSDHEYGVGQQSSFKLFVECFSSPPPISSTSSRLSSLFSHRRAALKGSSFHNRHNRHHQQQPLHRADSTKSSSVHLHGATSNSAEVNASSATIPSTKKAYKKKRSTKKQSNNYSQKKYSKQKGAAAAAGGGSIPKHMMNAARQYNSQLTKCNSVSELLSSFMEQTSTTSSTTAGDNTSSATHLAGANKLNSVNFSTCLHRLARFAAKGSYSSTPSTSNMNQNDARKQVLSDPRFALLVCSMAEMASGVDASTSVKMGNEMVLQQWGTMKCGNNGVEGERMREADDVLNDIVGLSSGGGGGDTTKNDEGDDHNIIDVATVTVASRFEAAEQIMNQLSIPQTKNTFSSRECSNVCWALAKLRVSPPSSAFALGRVVVVGNHDENGSEKDFLSSRQFVSLDEMALDVVSSTLQVRMQLFEEARKRKSGGSSNGAWIPELSRLAGKVMDLIAVKIINEYGMRNDGSTSSRNTVFNPQEMASVLWAYAKSGERMMPCLVRLRRS